jgi:Zn-dependent peptidase ImmA (M78 family)
LERYFEAELLATGAVVPFSWPDGFPYFVAKSEEAEDAAERLRQVWQLGLEPIENFTELLEERGIKTGLVEAHSDFTACAFWADADRAMPVIVVQENVPGDRLRFSLAHELGHLLLAPESTVDLELAANRFAGALLVPADAARRELGKRRQCISLYELHTLKHKYGLSMQGWIHRAEDLAILSPGAVAALRHDFVKNNWRKVEPGDPYSPEVPSRFTRLVVRALAEDVISDSRAAELLARPLEEFGKEVSEEHGGLPIGVGSGHEYLD